MKATYIRLLQQNLIAEGFRPGPVDGVLGDKTYAAAEKALKKRVTRAPALVAVLGGRRLGEPGPHKEL